MFDFSFGEIGVIGVVALVVLGPERMPKVARTIGEWIGKAQRYVNEVKSDINREMELAELKKLKEEAQNAAQSIRSSVQGLQADLSKAASDLTTSLGTTTTPPPPADDYAFEGTDESWQSHRFSRRYKPGPSIDELAEEVARLKRELALPDAYAGTRGKYAPRARTNRPRIRR